MEPINQSFQSFKPGSEDLVTRTVDQVRAEAGHDVKTFSELVFKLAQLAFENPEFVLLLRGQTRDYPEEGKTTLFPSIYREKGAGIDAYHSELTQRYTTLRDKELALCGKFQADFARRKRVGRSELARWAILQHYEVCPTPLLDVTYSAHVAASFALQEGDPDQRTNPTIYVLGVPQLSGSVTVSAAQEIQIVRLSSVCPPETLRPYFQDGYLVGTYPSVDDFDKKRRYKREETDCARRLVAKFHIATGPRFWGQGYQCLPECAVYPREASPLIGEIEGLKENAGNSNR